MPHTSSAVASPIDLDRPLPNTLSASHLTMLEALQGNILKAHGKPHAALLLLQFGDAQQAKQFLASLAPDITSAASQLSTRQRASHAAVRNDGFLTCAISATGYRALGLEELMPDDAAFREGLKERGPSRLDDPIADSWEGAWNQQVDATLLIAAPKPELIESRLAELQPRLDQYDVKLLGVEHTKLLRNERSQVIEHFGYVDGISRPTFFDGDAFDVSKPPGVTQLYPLKSVLVHDRAVADPLSFGSYFVVRKIEQNVANFVQYEHALQQALEQTAGDGSIPPGFAGATLIGRFRDGTPLVTQRDAGVVTNDFTFASDPLGFKCPFHAHIRNVNPRGETGDAREGMRVLVRRGMTYGARERRDDNTFDLPSEGVGLLFQSFQASIIEQFEHVMKHWMHNSDFPRLDAGLDAVVGQGTTVLPGPPPWETDEGDNDFVPATRRVHRAGWNDAAAPTVETPLQQFLTFLGGEYFFAPSVTFVKQLASEV